MFESVMPLLHVSNAQAAVEFYARLGFLIEYAHGPLVSPTSPHADPCYMALSRDNVWIILSSFSGDGVAGGVVNFQLGRRRCSLRRVCGRRDSSRFASGGPDVGHPRDVCARPGPEQPSLH